MSAINNGPTEFELKLYIDIEKKNWPIILVFWWITPLCNAIENLIVSFSESKHLPGRPSLEVSVAHTSQLLKLMSHSDLGACAFANMETLMNWSKLWSRSNYYKNVWYQSDCECCCVLVKWIHKLLVEKNEWRTFI